MASKTRCRSSSCNGRRAEHKRYGQNTAEVMELSTLLKMDLNKHCVRLGLPELAPTCRNMDPKAVARGKLEKMLGSQKDEFCGMLRDRLKCSRARELALESNCVEPQLPVWLPVP